MGYGDGFLVNNSAGGGGGNIVHGGTWTPTISSIKVNGAANANGMLSILSANYIEGGNADSFQVYYFYRPPSNVNLSLLNFTMTFPFGAEDFYGYNSVFYNETNAQGDYISGDTGGGGLYASEDESAAPYTKGVVELYMDNDNDHNAFPILGIIEGVLINE